MGMFDYVKFKGKCPECGTDIKDFQSKDRRCGLDQVDFREVDNFYAGCPNCKTWVEYRIKLSGIKKRLNILNIDDYERVITKD